MAENFFQLPTRNRIAVLRSASEALQKPAAILEKDIMVVWALAALFESAHGGHLSFKGGTSLSKVFGIIDRFSEDVDVTYDIRHFLPDFDVTADGIPPSKSKGRKWTEEVRARLPSWISDDLVPILKSRAARDGVKVSFRQESKERLFVDYDPLHRPSSDYIKPAVMLEFGARSTGEPAIVHTVTCDAASPLSDVGFPIAKVRTMQVERTFWEKATAAHVYCHQKNLKGDRFSRHWHDLHYIANSAYFNRAIEDRDLALKVADHKSYFFAEKNSEGEWVDYRAAVSGDISLVPSSEAFKALKADYEEMRALGVTNEKSPDFNQIMDTCRGLEKRINSQER